MRTTDVQRRLLIDFDQLEGGLAAFDPEYDLLIESAEELALSRPNEPLVHMKLLDFLARVYTKRATATDFGLAVRRRRQIHRLAKRIPKSPGQILTAGCELALAHARAGEALLAKLTMHEIENHFGGRDARPADRVKIDETREEIARINKF